MIKDFKIVSLVFVTLHIIGYALINIVLKENRFIPYINGIWTVVIIILINRFISYRIKYLSYIIDSSNKIAKGDLDYKIQEKGSNSFSILAKNFNSISDIANKNIKDNIKNDIASSKLVQEIYRNNGIQKEKVKKMLDEVKNNLQSEVESINIVEIVQTIIKPYQKNIANYQLDLKFNTERKKIHVKANKELTTESVKEFIKNAFKNAMPNTNLYIDIKKENDSIYMSIKNICKEETTMEKILANNAFSIELSKRMLEIQGIKVNIDIDADLFKVELLFNKDTSI